MTTPRPTTWTIATRASKDEIDAMRRAFAPSAEVAALVEQDLANAREAARARAEYNAAAVGLPGITRGAAVTYLDGNGDTRRGTFDRVAEFGHGTGRRFRLAYRRVVVATTTGEAVYVEPGLVEAAPAAALPECTNREFTPGNRCTVCRVHRTNHAA